jgi:hypothetical protein
MKKVYLLIAMFLIAGMSFAQLKTGVSDNGYVLKNTNVLSIDQLGGKETIDTMGWTAASIPVFGGGTSPINLSRWGMTDGTNFVGYWFGTSGDQSADSVEADYWAQCWVNGSVLKVSGILFYAAGKTQYSAGTGSNLIVGVQKMSPYAAGAHGCIIDFTTTPYTFTASPVTPYLGQATVNIADFDTTFATLNWAPFASLANVPAQDFCAVANFKAMRVAGDTAMFWADQSPAGLEMNFAQYCQDPAGYYWVSTYLNGTNADLDVNMSIFAVIDDGAGVNEDGYFQGMKMSVRSGSGYAYVDYILAENSNVKLSVIDITGREVAVYNEGTKTSIDLHTIAVNTSGFNAGTYFLSLTANGGRFTQKLIVE